MGLIMTLTEFNLFTLAGHTREARFQYIGRNEFQHISPTKTPNMVQLHEGLAGLLNKEGRLVHFRSVDLK